MVRLSECRFERCFKILVLLFFVKKNICSLGELSGRLVGDLDIMREGIGLHLAEFISIVSRVIASVIFSLYTGWKLTLVFLSISPLIILAMMLLIRVSFAIMKNLQVCDFYN